MKRERGTQVRCLKLENEVIKTFPEMSKALVYRKIFASLITQREKSEDGLKNKKLQEMFSCMSHFR